MSFCPPRRIIYGRIYAHALSFEEAVERIVGRAKAREGGFVVTPNVDHIVLAEKDPELCDAYEQAFLSLADGQPLLWMARLLKQPRLQKISGSDLFGPLLKRASEERLSVYFLGSTASVLGSLRGILARRYPEARVVGVDPTAIDLADGDAVRAAVERIRTAAPQLLMVALGCPKQEYFMLRTACYYPKTVALGIGATLDFIAGHIRRAPHWMQRSGLEWVYRLAREPRRLAKRYLIRDREILPIFWRMWRQQLSQAPAGVVRED